MISARAWGSDEKSVWFVGSQRVGLAQRRQCGPSAIFIFLGWFNYGTRHDVALHHWLSSTYYPRLEEITKLYQASFMGDFKNGFAI
jgi:hypothetical protein